MDARHQAFVDRAGQALGGGAGVDAIGIEIVEGAQRAEPQHAALGGLGIGVGQVVEIRAERRVRHAWRWRG